MRKLEAKSNQALMAFCLNRGVFHQWHEIAFPGAPNLA